jgi:hypothetical protein
MASPLLGQTLPVTPWQVRREQSGQTRNRDQCPATTPDRGSGAGFLEVAPAGRADQPSECLCSSASEQRPGRPIPRPRSRQRTQSGRSCVPRRSRFRESSLRTARPHYLLLMHPFPGTMLLLQVSIRRRLRWFGHRTAFHQTQGAPEGLFATKRSGLPDRRSSRSSRAVCGKASGNRRNPCEEGDNRHRE